MEIAETILSVTRTEGHTANPNPSGTRWGDKMLLANLHIQPEPFDSNTIAFTWFADHGNFHTTASSAHHKIRLEHNRLLAEPLRAQVRQKLHDVTMTMRSALTLLSGRTQMTITIACKPTLDTPMASLTIDGHHLQRQKTPVRPNSLYKRIAPVFASLHAFEQAHKPTERSDHIWGWANTQLRVAAPTAVDAWFKSLVLHDPVAPFDPATRSYHFTSPVLYLDENHIADGITVLRHKLCPQGAPYP
jgi:hypothetical protein